MQNRAVAVGISRLWANVELAVEAMKLGTTTVNRGEVLDGLKKSGSFRVSLAPLGRRDAPLPTPRPS
jgi:hypothetical protein